jgi:release factor glutamine methyltransferase
MTSGEFYRFFIQQLKGIYDAHEASNITSMIFESFAGISRSDIIKDSEIFISEDKIEKIKNSLADLIEHKPVQYVLGEAWFFNLKFIVNENVLIPRPETEELVQEVIYFCKSTNQKKIIDIGTGSGCIPVSIKVNIPEADITTIDIDSNALAVAIENAKRNQAEIFFLQTDFLNAEERNRLGKYDIIISNPPYIPESEKDTLGKNVTAFEPHLALFVPDSNPFLFYESIADFCKHHLDKNGKLFLEVHENLAKEVGALLEAHQLKAEIKKDIFEKERIVMATHYR